MFCARSHRGDAREIRRGIWHWIHISRFRILQFYGHLPGAIGHMRRLVRTRGIATRDLTGNLSGTGDLSCIGCEHLPETVGVVRENAFLLSRDGRTGPVTR